VACAPNPHGSRPWHEYVRLQRITGEETYSDARPSLPTAGAEPFLGILFAFGTEIVKGQRHRYGDFGDSYVSVVEFSPEVRARSILVFGKSGDPKSPYYFDRVPLYAQGEFKPAWLTLSEIKVHLEPAYHPGER